MRRSWWRRPSLQTAIVAVILSILFWLLVVYSPNTVTRTLVAPIELRNLPENWIVEGDVPSAAEVVLSGPEQLFRRMDPADLALSIDASQPSEGVDEIVLAEDDLNLPAGIDLNRIQPRMLRVEMRRLESVRVPVLVRTSGTLPDTLVLAAVLAEPDSVTIMVPVDAKGARDWSVQTQAVNLDAVVGDSSITRSLVLPDNARLPSGASEDVVVRVEVLSNSVANQDGDN